MTKKGKNDIIPPIKKGGIFINNYTVYKHIFPNNKVYIGVTCRKPEYRWDNGKGYYKNGQSRMYNAIQKYGWENVKHEILFENLTKEEAEQKEIELIEQYKSYNDKFGYNITKGGSCAGQLTKEMREKMSISRKGKIPWNKGIPCREETKRKLSETNKGQKAWNKGIPCSEEVKQILKIKNGGKNNYWYGKKLSVEHKEKISNSKKGIRKGGAIKFMQPVLQLDLERNFIKRYDCLKDAEKETGIPYQNISMCCRKKVKKTHNYIFEYEKEVF